MKINLNLYNILICNIILASLPQQILIRIQIYQESRKDTSKLSTSDNR